MLVPNGAQGLSPHHPDGPWRHQLSERAALGCAVAAAIGSILGRPLPLAIGIAGVMAAVAWRKPWLFCVAILALSSALSYRASAGLDDPPLSVEGWGTLVSDPERLDDATRTEVRIDGRRFQVWARGPSAGLLAPRLAGEQIRLRATVRPFRNPDGYTRSRHLVGVLQSPTIDRWRAGSWVTRVANGYRRTLVEGAASLPDVERTLFTGFVVGDDRGQDPVTEDDFRAAGLAHLLAVSGQNVAFLLALAGPVLRRLERWPRLSVVVILLAVFGLVTRFEPSVLRATTMAAIAVLGVTLGREASPRRVLALAVTGLLLIDPLLVHALAFRLSVAASFGIILLAAPIGDRLPLPTPVRDSLAVTIAAQLAVAPVLVPAFDSIPVVSVPANLVAGVASGPIVVWGMSAGLVAGLLGESTAALIHLPTGLLVGFVAWVARFATALGWGELGGWHLVGLGGAVGFGIVGRRMGRRWVARVAAGTAVLILSVAAFWNPRPPARAQVAHGVTVFRGEERGVVVLVGADARADQALEALRRNRVRHIDILVLDGITTRAVTTARALDRRLDVRLVVAPGGRLDGSVDPEKGDRFEVGGLVVEVDGVTPSLDIQVGSDRAAGARDPPL